MPPTTNRKPLFLLGPIAALIRWIEELANLLSGPLLTIGLGIALIDLLTDGSLLTAAPALLYTWAITQAVGVDAQLVATWDRARLALREHRYWSLVGLILLGAVLAYVAWVAAQVFALQQSEGLSTGAALSRLGMDSAVWLVQRTALSVFLVCLAGWTRYHPPAQDVTAEAERERVQLESDLMLEPLRQQLRNQRARGLRGALDSIRGKEPSSAAPSPSPLALPAIAKAPKSAAVTTDHSRPPTGPGSPATAHTLRESSAEADSALASITDETPDYDEEAESSRVLHINRGRTARNVNRRVRREGQRARRTRIRDAVYTVLDSAIAADSGASPEAVEEIAINELTRRVNTSLAASGDTVKTSAATVKHHRTNWLRDQRQQAVQ